MALRNQPYIPLYVDDVLSDEKLCMCSPEAHGVYFLLLCLLHKQEVYGKLSLKQKYKQSKSKAKNFASYFAKQMPFEQDKIEASLLELLEEEVIGMTEDMLWQKRMMSDGAASLSKAEIGKLGGTHSARQYGKPGTLFWMSDYVNKQKVGTSINSQNRLYRTRSDYKLKTFDIIEEIPVSDMGIAEDISVEFFKDKIDGEFINIPYQEMAKKFVLCSAKIRANKEQISVIGIVNANEEAKVNKEGNTNNSNTTEFALLEATDEQSKDIEQSDESIRNKKRYDNFKKFLLNQQMWCEEVCMKTHSKMDDLPGMIDNFISHCLIGGEVHTSEKEFQTHFRNLCLSKIDIVKTKNIKFTQEDIDKKKEDFLNKVLLYNTQYDPQFLEGFFIHWSQVDNKTNLLKWEMEKAFEIPNRLIAWKENNKKFTKNGSSGKHSGSDYKDAAKQKWG